MRAARALARVTPLKDDVDQKFAAGRIDPSHYHFLVSHYYDVVATLERQKMKLGMANKTREQEYRHLLEMERKAYQESFEARRREYQIGKATTPEFLFEAQRRLLTAELKLCAIFGYYYRKEQKLNISK